MAKSKKNTNDNAVTNISADGATDGATVTSTARRTTRARSSTSSTIQPELENQPTIPTRVKRTKEEISAAKAEKEKTKAEKEKTKAEKEKMKAEKTKMKAEKERMKAEKAAERIRRLVEKEMAKEAALKEKADAEEIKKKKLEKLKDLEAKMEDEREKAEMIPSIKTATAVDISTTKDSNTSTTSGSAIVSRKDDTATATVQLEAAAAAARSVQWKVPESTFIDPLDEDDYSSDTSIASTEIVDEDSVEASGAALEMNETRRNILERKPSSYLLSDSPMSDVSDEDSEDSEKQTETKVILRIPGRKVLQQSDINLPMASSTASENSKGQAKTDMSWILTTPSDDPDIVPDNVSQITAPDEDIDMVQVSDGTPKILNTEIAANRAIFLPDSTIDGKNINANINVQKGKRRLSESNECLTETCRDNSNPNKRPKSTQNADNLILSNDHTERPYTDDSNRNWRLKAAGVNNTSRLLSPGDAVTRRSVSPCLSKTLPLREGSASTSVDIQLASAKKDETPEIQKRVTTMTAVRVNVGTNLNSRAKKSTNDNNSKSSNGKRFTMSDILVDHRRFRSVFIQTYYEYYMTLPNPFKLQNQQDEVISALQQIWDTVFAYEPLQFTTDCSVKYVADQRFIEYRGRIAEVACKIVGKFFEKKQAEDATCDDVWRRTFVNLVLGHKNNPSFIWKNFELTDFEVKKKGIFRHKFIVETLAYHFHEIRNSDQNSPPIKENNLPRGALAIAACAVERALEMWISGFQEENKHSFSADNYRERAQYFSDLAAPEVLSGKQWGLIFEDAIALISIHATSRSSSPAPQEIQQDVVVNVADIVAMDEDSDLNDN